MSSASLAKKNKSSGPEPGTVGSAPRPAVRALTAWLPVILFETVILVVSTRHMSRPPLPWTYGDKMAHLAEYAVLGALLHRALRFSGLRPTGALLLTVLLAAALGAGDEWVQSFVPTRVSSVYDWMADVAGGLAGAWAVRMLENRFPVGWLRPQTPAGREGRP